MVNSNSFMIAILSFYKINHIKLFNKFLFFNNNEKTYGMKKMGSF